MARTLRLLSAVTATAVMALSAGPAAADPAPGPPAIDSGLTPSGSTGAEVSMRQDKKCASSAVMGNVDVTKTAPALTSLDVPDAWQFSRGAGVTVAVLGTGVEQHFRLPNLRGGGDFVGSGDGLTDCDAFGTLVAGVIAGSQSTNDGFSGVAPEASILSLRVTSAAFTADSGGRDNSNPNDSDAAIYARALARAVVAAANAGAQVIAIPQPACMQAAHPFDQGSLGAAVQYATKTKNAVVVAASGNTVNACQQNPPYTAANPNDPRNWGNVSTVSTPSVFSNYVLSVGMTTLEGLASDQTLQGPWVGIGAPGMGIVTTGTDGADLVNAVRGGDKSEPIAGSAYSTAIVAGVAALVRSKYPGLSALDVIKRLQSTAHHPPRGTDNLLGYGTVDPVAALTASMPTLPAYDTAGSVPVKPAAHSPSPDRRPKVIAGVIALAALVLAVGVPTGLILARKQEL